MKHILAFFCFSWLLFLLVTPSLGQPFKAVNLGAWLVSEGWMTPWLFDNIVNKDLLDGTQIQLKSTMLSQYVAAENGGGTNLLANRDNPSGWEIFTRVNDTFFNLKVFNKQFVGKSNQGSNAVAVATTPGDTETFPIIRNGDDPSKVLLKASSDQFLQAKSGSSVTIDYQGSTDWSDQNPYIFKMSIVSSLSGEYQLTNGYGPDKAPQVIQNHWNTYIKEDDFIFMSQNGINAVRIPVGWWIKYDQTPPKPFVGGSLQALDNDFNWAEKHNIKVIIDLHAVLGSQNGNDHSATRDGSAEWGDSKIGETVEVIDFLTKRYANRPGLVAIELMNEPHAQYVPLNTLIKYYQAGYDAVRKYNSTAYVILSNRLGNAKNTELLSFAHGLPRSVIDVHYYNLYSDEFNVQQNIDYIYNQRASTLGEITQSNGPLTFVGEWVNEFANGIKSNQDYQNFGKVQLDVYGRSTFGWAYWSYKCQYDHWSLRNMIEKGIINLK
ncbi:glucan 1,3-beta-glucosidase-like [Lycium barbarum]|uniref:glucan 1,3-beta-glucosidase-like n=1 Tax=Lycium barbarum TaxID=112863 RepID=UPI00293EBBEE|nr:glucan 1,3-beta-glucosidase-like [Lycium barbarum]